jgi:transcriptional regulator with XRE-family HTH domain
MKKRKLDAVYRAFGNLLRVVRKQQRGLSQEKLGRLVGLSRTSITNIEKGRHHIALHQLLTLARVLKVRPEALLPSERATEWGHGARKNRRRQARGSESKLGRPH